MTDILETPAVDTLQLVQPGVYDDIPEDKYHADPVPGGSLSSSGARKLLPPSCPAIFDHERRHPTPPSKTLDFGSAAHRMVLGYGPELEVVHHPDWRTKAAREQADTAHTEGRIPVLAKDYERILDMAAAIRRHPIASALLDPEQGGRPEQTMIWQDQRTDVWLRARIDWLPEPSLYRRTIITDYKTARSANPQAISKAVYEHGYHQQAAFYLDGATQLGWADETAAFVFIFQEKEPPYIVTVVELDPEALMWGAALNRRAIDIYRECTDTGHWPDYTGEVQRISLPGWAVNQYEAAHARGEL